MNPSSARRSVAASVALALAVTALPGPAVRAAGGGAKSISAADLKAWLTQISSDEFEGRATFTEGLGLAASYIAGELRAMGVKPGGDRGSYFQRVSVLGVKATSRHTVTVTVNGQSRTFKDGEGITLPRNAGGKQTLTSDQIEFVGYGAVLPAIKVDDYAGRNVAGKVVVYLGARGPKGGETRDNRRLLGGRSRYATDVLKAMATIGPFVPSPFGPQAAATPSPSPAPSPAPAAGGPGGGGFGRAPLPNSDFTTVERLDKTVPPAVTAQDEFFEFLFSGADVKYADLKARAANQEPLPQVSLQGVSMRFGIDADYEIVRTQFTRNVVGIIEGADPKLKDTYVAFGAHYDHVGYAEGEVVDVPASGDTPAGKRRLGAAGQVTPGAVEDRIWNGADDDGSGTVTLLSLAKAFATAPRTRRSLVFVWHTGEERGLWGSRYYADYPSVPMDKIVAQLNMDMVGRNDKNDPREVNTVYLVGSDRISTELHNINEEANASLKPPMKIDYSSNDPGDGEQIYYRSDHYSYAAKGVPIIFYTTGLHPDYHANTDSVEKIEFDKMARISELMYETGRRVANLDHAPAHDNKGPRVGKGSTGKLQP
ncbi:MAG: M28 family peptidase [Vicinamibacteria bacterium]|nr:M28 family peptidase [Vicinamibacteria bacterium]